MPPPKQDSLRSVWRRPRPAPQDTDPADHGTAFGLELSLDNAKRISPDGVAAATPATASSAEAPARWWSPMPAKRPR
jgi:hypothetical protein